MAPPPVEVTPTTNPTTVPISTAAGSMSWSLPRYRPKKQKARRLVALGPRVRRFVYRTLIRSHGERGGIAEAEGLRTGAATTHAHHAHAPVYTYACAGSQVIPCERRNCRVMFGALNS